MIYESPSFDFSLSERSMLKAAANELVKLGDSEVAETYFAALREVTDYKEINKLLIKASNDLGKYCSDYMWFEDDKQIIDKIAMNSYEARNLWGKSTKTRFKLLKDWRVYNNVFSELSKVNKPSLLLKGKYDPITCEVQIKEFMNRVSDKKVITFDYSGHWIRVEEPDKYCDVITNYINEQAVNYLYS